MTRLERMRRVCCEENTKEIPARPTECGGTSLPSVYKELLLSPDRCEPLHQPRAASTGNEATQRESAAHLQLLIVKSKHNAPKNDESFDNKSRT